MRCKSDLLKKRGGRQEDEQCRYKKFGRLVEMCLFQCYPWRMASLPGMSLHRLTRVAQSLARNSLWEAWPLMTASGSRREAPEPSIVFPAAGDLSGVISWPSLWPTPGRI